MGGVIFTKDAASKGAETPKEVVSSPKQEVKAVSTKPVITSHSKPERNSKGLYSFTVNAEVESGDRLVYELFEDEKCSVKIGRDNMDGKFSDVAVKDVTSIYARVFNLKTDEQSELHEISGFEEAKAPEAQQLPKFRKITSAEIQQWVNVDKSTEAAFKGYTKSLASGYKIEVRNQSSEEVRPATTVADMCNKVQFGTWKSIQNVSINYDAQDRITKISVDVNY